MNETAMQASAYEAVDASGSDEYLTFMMDGEEYGIDILRVQGIQGWGSITPIPNTPDYVLGVVNLRGTVVPIIELRRRFQLSSVPFDATTVVVVVKIESAQKTRTVGLVVDAVSDVYSIEQEAIKPAPNFGARVNTNFVKGLATVDEKMVILLEIDELLGDEMVDAMPAEGF